MSLIYPSSSITVQNIINDTSTISEVSTETNSTETTSTETTSTETTSTETTSNTYSITVTAQSSSNYILSGSDQNGNVSGNDPSISLKAGDTFSFNVNSPGHPFFIIVNSNGGFESNNLPSGITNNGASTGTVLWTPTEAGTYYYICEYHPSMIGTITVTQ
jgi:plastocyanin